MQGLDALSSFFFFTYLRSFSHSSSRRWTRSLLIRCERNRIYSLSSASEVSLLKCGHLGNYLFAWSREFSRLHVRRKFGAQYSLFWDWVSTHLHEDVDHKALWLAWLNEVRQLTGDGGVGFLFCDVHDVSRVPLFAGWMHPYPVGEVSTPTSCSLRRIKSFNVDYQRCERLEAGGFFQGDDPTAQVISLSQGWDPVSDSVWLVFLEHLTCSRLVIRSLVRASSFDLLDTVVPMFLFMSRHVLTNCLLRQPPCRS